MVYVTWGGGTAGDRSMAVTIVRDRLFIAGNLFHAVEGAAGLEPRDLLIVECVVQLDFVDFAVGVFDFSVEWFAGGDALQAEQRDFVGRLDLERGRRKFGETRKNPRN